MLGNNFGHIMQRLRESKSMPRKIETWLCGDLFSTKYHFNKEKQYLYYLSIIPPAKKMHLTGFGLENGRIVIVVDTYKHNVGAYLLLDSKRRDVGLDTANWDDHSIWELKFIRKVRNDELPEDIREKV